MGILDAIGNIGGMLLGRELNRDAAEDRRSFDSEQARLNAEAAERVQRENIALQREFAQSGIQWRVADAKAAGLHPLYAIGGSGASFSPNPVVVGGGSSGGGVDYSEMGQNVGRAVAATLDPDARALKDAQLDVLKAAAAKDYALAAAASSEAARGRQNPAAPIPLAVPTTYGDELSEAYWARGRVEDPQHQVDTVRYKPDDVTSVSAVHPYSTAGGNRAFYSEYVFPGGFKMQLPAGSSPSEAIEALGESPLTALMVYQHNKKHYGAGWAREFGKQFPGLSSLIEAGEELSEPLGRLVDRYFPSMPPAKGEFGPGKIPDWYRKPRFDLNRIYDRWSIKR